MRPILWGLILFLIGMVGVFGFGMIGIMSAVAGRFSLQLWILSWAFALLFYFSLPVAIAVEVVRWVRKRRGRAPKREG